MRKLRERPLLDLAHALGADAEHLGQLAQGALRAVETEALGDDRAFPLVEPLEQAFDERFV